MDLGLRIKQLRVLRKLSQKEIALDIGINQGQYSRIESGKVEPTLASLRKIAEALEVSISELLSEDQDLNQEINVPLLEKVKLIEQLEDKEKDSILTIIDMAIAKKRFKDNLSSLLASDQ